MQKLIGRIPNVGCLRNQLPTLFLCRNSQKLIKFYVVKRKELV